MKKVRDLVAGVKGSKFYGSVRKSGFVTAFALMVIGVAEISTQACIFFLVGQEDMPDELL